MAPRRASGAGERDSPGDDARPCCVPGECLRPRDPVRLEDAIRVLCNNEACTAGRYMHRDCFEQWEAGVLAYLKSCGRARSWSERQRHQNLWTKKGYDLAFKACGCRCGRGHLKKDADWAAQGALGARQEDDKKRRRRTRTTRCTPPSADPVRPRALSLSSSGSCSPPSAASESSVSPTHHAVVAKKNKQEFFSDRVRTSNEHGSALPPSPPTDAAMSQRPSTSAAALAADNDAAAAAAASAATVSAAGDTMNGLPIWLKPSKKRHIARLPQERNAGAKKPTLSNTFAGLRVDKPSSVAAQVSAVTPPTGRVTPIIIERSGLDAAKLRDALKLAGIANFSMSTSRPGCLTLQLQSKEDKNKAFALLSANKCTSHFTYTDKCDERYVSTISGLAQVSSEELDKELTNLGFKPEKVAIMKGGDPDYPRFQVTLPKNVSITEFRKIRKLCNCIIKIEKYQANNKYGTMCTRCQTFGHAARNCGRAPRCVKCIGAHHTSECDKPSGNAQCCNCLGDHAASYRQCPQRLRYLEAIQETKALRQSKQGVPTPTPTQRGFTSNFSNGRGWAAVTSGSALLPTPAAQPTPHTMPSAANVQYHQTAMSNTAPQYPTLPPPRYTASGVLPRPQAAAVADALPQSARTATARTASNPPPISSNNIDFLPSQHQTSNDLHSTEELINLIKLAGELRKMIPRSMPIEQKLITIVGFLDRIDG